MIKKRKTRHLEKTENEQIPETVVTNRYLAVFESSEMYPDLDPRIEGNQKTVFTNGHLASEVDKILVPRHYDL